MTSTNVLQDSKGPMPQPMQVAQTTFPVAHGGCGCGNGRKLEVPRPCIQVDDSHRSSTNGRDAKKNAQNLVLCLTYKSI